MTAKNYIFIVALCVFTPIFLGFVFYNIYKDLKKKKLIKKMGRAKTIYFFVVLAVIASLTFLVIYLFTSKVIILGILIYLMLIYVILDKSAKKLLKYFTK